MIDHDRLFKELLSTFFVEFIELFFAELAAYLDPRSLVFLDKELFSDVTSGERHEADLIARGKFRGQDSFFLVHVEHQAQDQRDVRILRPVASEARFARLSHRNLFARSEAPGT